MKYRKRPVEIEAFRFTGGISYDEMSVEWGVDFVKVATYSNKANVITIKTLEGDMVASLNDFIIQGVQGEYYPCKPDIFDLTYEKV